MPDVIVASRLQFAVRMYMPGSEVFYDVIGIHDPASLAVAGVGITYGVDEAAFDAWVAANQDAAPFVKVVTQSEVDYYSDPANTHGYELGLIPPAPPANVDIPHVSQNGTLLNCTMGNWTGEPTSYSYQWQLDGANADTDANTFTVSGADNGKTAICIVTATNDVGSVAAPPSNGVVVAVPVPPVNTAAVMIQQVGGVINSSTGTWTSTPPATYSYQWKRGATNVGTDTPSYPVVAADYGQSMTCVVTATNPAGSTAAPPSNAVIATNPNPTAAILTSAAITDPAALLATLAAIADAGFAITINGTAREIGPLDFGGADSLGYCAAMVNTALGAEAVCAAAGDTAFTITTAATGTAATISYAGPPATGTDISTTCGLTQAAGATIVNGT